MAELKSCPFCGAKAEIIVFGLDDKNQVYMPRCKEKYCCGRICKKWADYETAVYAWNKRIPDAVKMKGESVSNV